MENEIRERSVEVDGMTLTLLHKDGKWVFPLVTYYQHGLGTPLCLALLAYVEDSNEFESETIITVNLPGAERSAGCQFIDTNNNGEEVLDWLMLYGLCTPTGRYAVSGFCKYPEVDCKYSINSLVYWVTYVHNVVYSFYRSMIYCYINSTQRCAGSIVIDIIPTNGADKRKFFPFAPYFPVTNVIKRYFYPYFPAIIGIKGYSFPYFPYLSGIMKIKTALYSLFSRLDWHKTVVFPCLGEIYEGIRSLSWEIPVT